MPVVTEAVGIKVSLKEHLKGWLSKTDAQRAGTVHVSDVLWPRKAAMRRLYGPRMTEDELWKFLAGRAHGDIVAALVKGNRLQHQVPIEWDGIHGTLDVLDGIPVEIKSTRAFKKATVETISPWYLDQLRLYVALMDPSGERRVGRLVILYLINMEKREGDKRAKTHPDLDVFDIEFTQEEIQNALQRAYLMRDSLEMVAVGSAEHTVLPLCPTEWCPSCSYRVECRGAERSDPDQGGVAD